jgi:hypothetical protein
MSDTFDYATKADLYEVEARIERELSSINARLGRVEGQLTIMLRVVYYIAGLFTAIAIRVLFFKLCE